jgi:2-polyprenyl-3-methyl-5-hydroxy-6-metoxy-1,4-benzoquinol methylase
VIAPTSVTFVTVNRGRTTIRELVLGTAAGFRAFKAVTGGDRAMRTLVRDYIRPVAGERIIDVGCGFGDLARHLYGVEYHGVDVNPQYIEFANRHNTVARAEFHLLDVTELGEQKYGKFDCAALLGVLHHLSDDEVSITVEAVSQMLNAGGRLIAAEAVFDPSQATTARVLAALDRGRYVRDQARYRELVSPWFTSTETELRHDLFWFPYTHCIVRAGLAPEGHPAPAI